MARMGLSTVNGRCRASLKAGLAAMLAMACAEVLAEDRTAGDDRYRAVDEIHRVIEKNVADAIVVTIDHARLAEKEGVMMPPSIVTIFSSPAVNTALMKHNPRVGLDLPQKVLAYEEGTAQVAYLGSDFLAARHGLDDSDALEHFDAANAKALAGTHLDTTSRVGGDGVAVNYGIRELTSAFTLEESATRLKEAVLKQGDTVWFGEVDLRADAAALGETIPGAILLLFGAPKPGGLAMKDFPRLGLDAFCQKLLFYEDSDGSVKLIFNEIEALAMLHYGTSAKPHKIIDERLTATFKSAVTATE